MALNALVAQTAQSPPDVKFSIDPKMEGSWKARLQSEFDKPYFFSLKQFLENEKQKQQVIYPPGPHIFEAFKLSPFNKVKVVILGQDPYHGPGQAHGLCFSVQPGVGTPPSLVNIYKELAADIQFKIPNHGNLVKWAEQGVLLLNTVLTVRAHQAMSHHKRGWEEFTNAAISTLAQQRQGLVFMLWGRPAQDKASMIPSDQHLVLKAPHPSPLSAHRGFLGCKHFSQANEYLRARGESAIDWQV